jgi:hypothetical protein
MGNKTDNSTARLDRANRLSTRKRKQEIIELTNNITSNVSNVDASNICNVTDNLEIKKRRIHQENMKENLPDDDYETKYLAIISIESELLKDLETEDLINKFAKKHTKSSLFGLLIL